MPQERIESFNNNCTLVAVKAVLNGTKTDEEILEAFRGRGYVDNDGMVHSKWTGAAEDLGLELEKVNVKRSGTKFYTRADRYGWDEQTYAKYGRQTLASFAKEHPHGVYFVSTVDHALVLVDGQIWDPNCVFSGMTRGVVAAKKVVNSPLKDIPTTKICYIKSGRVGTKSWERRSAANSYIDAMGLRGSGMDPAEVIANTPYTRADYEYDKERGNIRWK